MNKVGQVNASPQLRLILGQVAPRLDLKFTMDNRRILIANLAKGAIGEQASNLLGSLIVSHGTEELSHLEIVSCLAR